MSMSPRAIQICQEFRLSSGGTTVSVRQFQAALDGPIVAFGGEGGHEDGAAVTIIPPATDKRGQLYGWAPATKLRAANALIAQADLVVIHMLYQYHAHWAANRARAIGVPYWVIPHGSLDPYVLSYRSSRKRLWLSALGNRIIRHAARVIFATERERDKAERTVGRLTNASVVRWPVAPAECTDTVDCRARARAELGLSMSDRVLLYLGRLHSMKRVVETIRAVARFSKERVILVVVGPDGDVTRAQCQAMCAQNRWDNIILAGAAYGAKRDEYYNAADGYILLSWRENFGHSVAEALARSLPVILGPGVDLAGDLRGVACGWLLSDVNEATVTRAISEFADASRETLGAMGAQGRAWSSRELTQDRFKREIRAMAIDDCAGGSYAAP